MALGAWPAMADDDGSTQFGTKVNKTLFDAIRASIEASVFSVTNPTISPAAIIDEVVAARGSKATLDARLDVSLAEDGTLLLPASLASVSNVQSTLSRNLFHDSLTMLWPDGDAAAPSGWVLSGTAAAVARAGSGGGSYESSAPGDATTPKYGKFWMKLTFGSAAAKLTKNIISSGAFTFGPGFKGRKFQLGVRVKASVASLGKITVDDGVTQTSTFHTGSGNEEFVTVSHTVSSSATKLDVICEASQAGTAYFGCLTLTLSDVALTDWISERWGLLIIGQQQRGTAAVASLINEFRHNFQFPAIMVDCRLKCKTAPATTAIIVRPAKTSATYPYATQPSIAAAATTGNRAPEGTYANRCFKKDDIFVWDVTQIGTGTLGDEVNAVFTFLVSMAELDLLGF